MVANNIVGRKVSLRIQAQMATPETDKLGRRVIIGIVGGVIVYAAIALLTDVRALATHLGAFPALVFAGALLASLINYAFRWAKWDYYLRVLDCEVDHRTSVVVFVAGLTMSITPGKVGEVLKSALLRRSDGFDVARTAPIVIAERLTDLLGLFVIAALGIAVFDFGRWAFVVILAVVVGGMVLVSSERAVFRLLRALEFLPWGEVLRPRLEEAYASMRRLIAMRPLIVGTTLSVVSWSMEAGAFFWILHTLDGSTGPYLAAFVYAMTTILGAVSFLPGGLGVTEGSMIGALLLFGVFSDEVVATTATYLVRLATLWFAVFLGIFGFAAFERMIKARAESSP